MRALLASWTSILSADPSFSLARYDSPARAPDLFISSSGYVFLSSFISVRWTASHTKRPRHAGVCSANDVSREHNVCVESGRQERELTASFNLVQPPWSTLNTNIFIIFLRRRLWISWWRTLLWRKLWISWWRILFWISWWRITLFNYYTVVFAGIRTINRLVSGL